MRADDERHLRKTSGPRRRLSWGAWASAAPVLVGGVLSVAAATPARAQEAAPAAATKGPRLTLDTKELDFGEVVLGAQVQLSVEVLNSGDAPLRIQQVKPSCGCTVASFPKELAPGERGTLGLVFDSSQRPPGYQSFRIAIYSNDPTQADMGPNCTVVTLRGDVRTLFRLAPQGAYFGEFVRGVAPDTKSIVVTGQGSARAGFTATLASELPDYLQVAAAPLPETDRRDGVRIEITLLPHVPLGELEQTLVFKTNVAEQPAFSVLLTGLITQRVTGPSAVAFGLVPRARGAERDLALERRDDRQGLRVLAVLHDWALLRVTHEELGPRRVEVGFRVVPGAPPGPFATVVRFLIDDPDQPVVEVPVYGRVEPMVRLDPAVLLVPAEVPAAATVAVLEVRHPVGTRIVDAALTPPGAGPPAEWAVVSQGEDRTTITLRAPRPVEAGGWPEQAKLVITTDLPGEERIEVPIVVRPGAR